MNVLKIQDVSKTYSNGTHALNKMNLRIENGMFGLLGSNGAGKSSLMRSIAGLQSVDSGTIYFNDVNLIKNPEAIKHCLGYLPQEFGVLPKLSAFQLLDHIAILKGILNKNERKEHIEYLLERTNLTEHRNRYVATFSGGMKQRFGIAQALLGKPKLIMVDEPTAGLDPEERNRFHNLLSEISEHIIVLLSTHIVEDVRELCTKMAIIGRGKLIVEGKPSELLSQLKGRVWKKTISRSELLFYQNRFNVISVRLIEGKTHIHILSETSPDTHFLPVEPDLEDVFFSHSLHQTKRGAYA